MQLHDTVASRVAEQLHGEIRAGSLAGGTPLRQNEVAARLGVSSTPVREAFQILERLGLVQREGRRGVRVFHPSVQDLLDCYEVRAVLEGQAVRRAVSHLGADDFAHLDRVLLHMEAADLPREQFMQLNSDFHLHIAAAAGNGHLTELIAAEQTATATYVSFLGIEPASRDDARDEHRAILDAMVTGDADTAARAMEQHLMVRAHALQGRLAAQGPSPV